MADFPCPSERIAASALLLLAMTTAPSISRSTLDVVIKEGDSIVEARKIKSCRGSLVSGDSKSIESSSELSDVSSEAISSRPIWIRDFVPQMDLQVVRKSRSKVQQISSENWKFSSSAGGGESSTRSLSVSGAESSCLTAMTTSSSADSSSARSRRDQCERRGKERFSAASVAAGAWRQREEARRRMHIGAHIRRRAEGILRMLSDGCFSEVTIRQVLGDSPDTSKALRILLKLEKVKRSGLGGRHDPFIYMIASKDIGNSR